CPNFPLSQWTLLLEGHAPDLEKVLSGHYSTTINPKQSQPLGKGFEITLSQPTTTHKVRTYGDWSIATNLWVKALTFIMPWKEGELWGYKHYLSGFFINIHYSLHSQVIDFDKACCLKVEGQKYLCFDAITEFRRLKVTHISSLGMVAYSKLQHLTSSPSGERARSDLAWGEPCLNWNHGACDRSTTNCARYHVCSKCCRSHKQTECSLAKASK
ncbi:hypothetical protein BDR03DRAFT_851124, partial [Suillus americanus]